MDHKFKLSVLLCTARPDYPYVDHPDWHVLETIVRDLSRQTVGNFELIIVDGCRDVRGWKPPKVSFPITWIAPDQNLWTENKKVAICTYRNTGIAYAEGELIVNLDDCCVLPPNYLEYVQSFWDMFEYCFVAQAPNDPRDSGVVRDINGSPYPMVYGFNTYPRNVAMALGGYDLAYDGGQGLEDGDFGLRMHRAGVKHVLHKVPGFDILAQSALSPHCIDLESPIAKCCNRAWTLQRVRRDVQVVNKHNAWTERERIQFLVHPPCAMLRGDGKCNYHNGNYDCPFPRIAKEGDPVADKLTSRDLTWNPRVAHEQALRKKTAQTFRPKRKSR